MYRNIALCQNDSTNVEKNPKLEKHDNSLKKEDKKDDKTENENNCKYQKYLDDELDNNPFFFSF